MIGNILILSAGRRVSLVKGFRDAIRTNYDIDVKVFAADLEPDLSAACQVADRAVHLPHVLDPRYPKVLLEVCQKLNVRLVVPTIDTELPVLADLRYRFQRSGIELIVSSKNLIAEFYDKRLTAKFFKKHNLQTPRVYSSGNISYPVLVKPYDGSNSVGILKLDSPEQMSDEIMLNPKNMFCQYINHDEHDEYTVDLYYDRSSKLRCVIPRKRLAVRGGEVSKALTEKNEIISTLYEYLPTLDGARGCLTFQLFRHNQTGEHWFIEVNPRFGGGYPLSRISGADFQSWLIDEYLMDRKIKTFENWKENTLMLRYDAEIVVNGYK